MAELKHRVVAANGIRIHLVEAGTGPLVLMVHGFPESWYSWRHQLHAFADAGYRAVAIDVRGYGSLVGTNRDRRVPNDEACRRQRGRRRGTR